MTITVCADIDSSDSTRAGTPWPLASAWWRSTAIAAGNPAHVPRPRTTRTPVSQPMESGM